MPLEEQIGALEVDLGGFQSLRSAPGSAILSADHGVFSLLISSCCPIRSI